LREKRRFRRFKASVKASYTKAKGLATINSESTTDDISATGLSTKASRLIKKGDDILIELKPKNHGRRIAILAKVIWSKPSKDKICNKCGLKFLWISSKSLLKDCIVSDKLKTA